MEAKVAMDLLPRIPSSPLAAMMMSKMRNLHAAHMARERVPEGCCRERMKYVVDVVDVAD